MFPLRVRQSYLCIAEFFYATLFHAGDDPCAVAHQPGLPYAHDTMIHTLSISICALACMVLVYTWMLYPVCMLALLRKRNAVRASHLPANSNTPHVSILISAWNEAAVIRARMDNLEALDYPRQSLSILVGTDGCTDHTADLVRAYCAHTELDVTLQAYPHNRGKASVLVDLVAQACAQQPAAGTVLVFTDANTFFQKDAITRLVARLDDARVGGVCGRLVFEQCADQPEQSYWSLETRLKEIEADYDSCLGANGAIYAIRAACFWQQLPPQTIIDDFVIGMKVREAGFRMVFEPRAVAFEDLPATTDEWKRRVRIGSGAYQAMAWCRACLHPRFGRFALFFWSHKILRWFSPHLFLLGTSAALLAVATSPAFHFSRLIVPIMMLTAALMLAGTVALHRILPPAPTNRIYRLATGIDHFVMMQAALLVGFVRFCRGNLTGTWHRTPRATNRESTP